MVATVGGAEPSRPRFRVNDETTVLDDDLAPAPVGVVGKLARRGHIPLGYYKDPEKTAATFPVVDGVRWSVPGDDARIEDDGTITLLGRGSVSINTGRREGLPRRGRGGAQGHPAVFDAIVVGVPDERWGERVVAVVQPRDGIEPPPDADARRAGPPARRRATRRRGTSSSSSRSSAPRRASPTTAGRRRPCVGRHHRTRTDPAP